MGAAALFFGSLLCAAALTAVAATIVVTHFGYPLLWALAAVATLAAARLRLSPVGLPT